MNRRNSKQPKYIFDQEQYFNQLCDYFENIACMILITEGDLPEGLTSYYIERQLYNRGALCYFAADFTSEGTAGEMALPVARYGKLNVYGIPTKYNLISPIKSFQRDITNSVLIRNNMLMTPTRQYIEPLMCELADIRAAMCVNRGNACKTPAVYTVDPSQALTVENTHKQITGNKPIIVKTLGASTSASYSKGDYAPYFGKELQEAYTFIKNEALTHIGTLYNPVEKAERVNVVESTSNQGELIDSLDSRLYFRQEAYEEINRMFDRHLTVKINNRATDQLLEGAYRIDKALKEGGADNVEIE